MCDGCKDGGGIRRWGLRLEQDYWRRDLTSKHRGVGYAEVSGVLFDIRERNYGWY